MGGCLGLGAVCLHLGRSLGVCLFFWAFGFRWGHFPTHFTLHTQRHTATTLHRHNTHAAHTARERGSARKAGDIEVGPNCGTKASSQRSQKATHTHEVLHSPYSHSTRSGLTKPLHPKDGDNSRCSCLQGTFQ
jgi:hypothetical protein